MILLYDVVDVPDVAAFAFVKVFAYRLKAFFFYVAFYVVVYIFIHNLLISISYIISIIVVVITFYIPHLVIIDLRIRPWALWCVEVCVLVHAVCVNLLTF